MTRSMLAVSLALLSLISAAPIYRREVPQEHSHEPTVTSVRASQNLNNAAGFGDPIFALLGDAAAANGVGSSGVTPECLQQGIADQAFTNAKAAGDVDAMTQAIIFRALERNTGAVGQTSKPCADQAANPEIAAIAQHQDPASSGAAATNKAIALNVAKSIASIGGDPQLAINSGTFAPGQIGDPTAAGNTCDDANDTEGCIFSQNLLVPDVTADEINAAVAGISAGSAAVSSGATATDDDCSEDDTASTSSAAPAASSTDAAVDDCEDGDASATSAAAPAATTNAAADDCADAAATTDAAAATATTSTTNDASASLDLGSCTDPSIKFAAGLDGRKETAFAPNNAADFNHGSADNIGVISSFICGQLGSKCGASQATVDACNQANASLKGLPAVGATADTFNAALGFQTNFAAVQTINNQGQAA